MQSKELLRSELNHYQILADRLKAHYHEIDDETLRDTLEGITELPDLIKELVRSSLDDEAYTQALRSGSKKCRPVWRALRPAATKSARSYAGPWEVPGLIGSKPRISRCRFAMVPSVSK
jgi:hypothetical protein